MSKAQYQRNKKIEMFLEEKQSSNQPLTKEEIAFINGFTGYGGLANFGATGKGLLSEYYTPISIVERMVSLAKEHGYTSGPVLEPSCGIGRFLHFFPPTEKVDALEINETSYQIATANFPTFQIKKQYFNELFVERNGNAKPYTPKYKLAIGNPPYGDFIGRFTTNEKKKTNATKYEEYFITRSLDVLLPGGLLIFIIPSSFLDGTDSKIKQEINKKSTLLDAYRLPKGIFQQTNIQTDIIILKKNPPN